jgi:hypothetical protein
LSESLRLSRTPKPVKARRISQETSLLESVRRWHTGANAKEGPTRLLVIDIVETGHSNTVLRKSQQASPTRSLAGYKTLHRRRNQADDRLPTNSTWLRRQRAGCQCRGYHGYDRRVSLGLDRRGHRGARVGAARPADNSPQIERLSVHYPPQGRPPLPSECHQVARLTSRRP